MSGPLGCSALDRFYLWSLPLSLLLTISTLIAGFQLTNNQYWENRLPVKPPQLAIGQYLKVCPILTNG